MEHNTKQLGEEKITRLLVRFSIPAIVGTLVNGLYNVIDRIFIGNAAGPLGIAGVTIGFPLMIITMAFGMLIGIGANSLVAIRLGEHRHEEAERIVGNSFVLLMGIALFLTVIGLIFINPLLRAFGASEAVLPYARAYMRIILLGTVFQAIGFGMNNFIRSSGKPLIAMLTMLLSAVLNIILAPVFIFGFGWGIQGAGWATVLSQMAAAAWVLNYFIRKRSFLRIRLTNLKLNPSIVWGMMAIGAAPCVMQLSASLLNSIINHSVAHYGGDLAVSVMGVVMSLMILIMLPVLGITQGAQPIIGYNYGGRRYDRVKETLKYAILGATAIVAVGYLVIMVFPEQLVALFNRSDPQFVRMGVKVLRNFLFFLPLIGLQIAGAQYFQAVGKVKQSMFLSLSRQVLILVPALLILPRFFGLQGILMAGPLADLLSTIITGTFLWLELRYLNGKHQLILQQQPQPE